MAFRLFKRFKIAPGLSVNLSKSGASLSTGPRGAKVTVGTRGVRRTVGVPGTGMYWTDHRGLGSSLGSKSGGSGRAGGSDQTRDEGAGPRIRPEDRLDLGFFKRLFIDSGEEAFVDGLRAYVGGEQTKAYRQLCKAPHIADASFIAGMIAIKQEKLADAASHLSKARARHRSLGKYFKKYGIEPTVNLYITEYIAALISADLRGIRLALAEVYQHQDQPGEAIKQLKQIYRQDDEDVIIRLSIAELLMDAGGDKHSFKQVVSLAQDIDNVSTVHAALLRYKAQALSGLGLYTAARDALTAAHRRKKDRPEPLLRQIRYDRALVYEHLGKKSRARGELEKIYAKEPDYEDVATRLGLD